MNSSNNTDEHSGVPVCPLYHPLSELAHKSGYYPNLNEDQFYAATLVNNCIIKDGLDFYSDGEAPLLKVLRFLRAKNFDMDDTMIMIRKEVFWRSQNSRRQMKKQSAADALPMGKDFDVYGSFPTWIQGCDKQKRPVSWRKLGKFDISNVLKQTTLKKLIECHVWEIEQLIRETNKMSLKSGFNIETFMIVIDASGWSVEQASRESYAFMRGLCATDSDFYPGRLGRMMIINAPSVFTWAWRILQGFLDDIQRSKISVHGSDQEEWKAVLFNLISVDQIPMEYGGTLPNLSPSDALETLNPPILSDDSRDVASSGIFCSIPFQKRTGDKKMKDKDKRNNDNNSRNNDHNAPLPVAVAVQSLPPSRWMTVFTCSPPVCNTGDDDFDYSPTQETKTGDDQDEPVVDNEKKKRKKKKSIAEDSSPSWDSPTDEKYPSDQIQKPPKNPVRPLEIEKSEQEVPKKDVRVEKSLNAPVTKTCCEACVVM